MPNKKGAPPPNCYQNTHTKQTNPQQLPTTLAAQVDFPSPTRTYHPPRGEANRPALGGVMTETPKWLTSLPKSFRDETQQRPPGTPLAVGRSRPVGPFARGVSLATTSNKNIHWAPKPTKLHGFGRFWGTNQPLIDFVSSSKPFTFNDFLLHAHRHCAQAMLQVAAQDLRSSWGPKRRPVKLTPQGMKRNSLQQTSNKPSKNLQTHFLKTSKQWKT